MLLESSQVERPWSRLQAREHTAQTIHYLALAATIPIQRPDGHS